MEEKMRCAILTALKDGAEKEENALYSDVYKLLNTEQINPRTALLFLDDEEMVRIRTMPGGMKYVRLSPKGQRIFWPKMKRVSTYCAENWIGLVGTTAALTAAITSIILLFK